MTDARPHVAFADCERIRPGFIGQPANTVSSLAFVAAALPIAREARRRDRPAWLAVAASSALEGVGSVAYHGPGGRGSKLVHDAGILALLGSMAVAVSQDDEPLTPRPHTAILTGAAIALHTLSRTGGPLCSCRSRLQGHALFHMLAAAALVSAARDRR